MYACCWQLKNLIIGTDGHFKNNYPEPVEKSVYNTQNSEFVSRLQIDFQTFLHFSLPQTLDFTFHSDYFSTTENIKEEEIITTDHITCILVYFLYFYHVFLFLSQWVLFCPPFGFLSHAWSQNKSEA